MKYFCITILVSVCSLVSIAQKTLLIEKIGTSSKYFYHLNDKIKIRAANPDTLMKGILWGIEDSSLSVATMRPYTIPFRNITLVYKQFAFPRKLGKMLAISGAVFFGVISFNHLINNEPVFSRDVFIVSGICFGGSIISFSLSERRCRIGDRWKLKVLDFPVKTD